MVTPLLVGIDETKVIILKEVVDAVKELSTDLTHEINSHKLVQGAIFFLHHFPLVSANKYLKTSTEISNWYLQSSKCSLRDLRPIW